MANHSDECIEFTAAYVVDYYNWLSGNGGKDPRELLAMPLSPTQRACLVDAMDDVNVVFAVTSPIREANRAGLRGAATRPYDVQALRGE